MVLEPVVQHVGVHAMLQGQGGNRGARLLVGGEQFALELRGIGTARARHRVARGLRVFVQDRVHVGFVDTILLRGECRIKMGLPAPYKLLNLDTLRSASWSTEAPAISSWLCN